jgi:hypothetical protein
MENINTQPLPKRRPQQINAATKVYVYKQLAEETEMMHFNDVQCISEIDLSLSYLMNEC